MTILFTILGLLVAYLLGAGTCLWVLHRILGDFRVF